VQSNGQTPASAGVRIFCCSAELRTSKVEVSDRLQDNSAALLLLLYSLPLPAALAAAALSYSQGELVHVRARARACA
jgi:hypothetical protein